MRSSSGAIYELDYDIPNIYLSFRVLKATNKSIADIIQNLTTILLSGQPLSSK